MKSKVIFQFSPIKDSKIDMSPHDLIAQIITDEKKTLELLTDVENLINTEIPK